MNKAGLRAIHSASVFCLLFNDSCQANYLKIYRTDLRQIIRAGRTTAVDDQSEFSFSDTSRDVAMATDFVAGCVAGWGQRWAFPHLVYISLAPTAKLVRV